MIKKELIFEIKTTRQNINLMRTTLICCAACCATLVGGFAAIAPPPALKDAAAFARGVIEVEDADAPHVRPGKPHTSFSCIFTGK